MGNLYATDKGLSSVSKELISYNMYDGSSLSFVGTPTVSSNGIISNINKNNYATFPVIFQNSLDIKVTIKGIYRSSSYPQCIFSFYNAEDTSNAFGIFISNNELRVKVGKKSTILIDTLRFKDNQEIMVTFESQEDTYSLRVSQNMKESLFSGTLKYDVPYTNYNVGCIGFSIFGEGSFWGGSLDLKKLLVSSNGNIRCNPTEPTFLQFTKVLISDGTIPLKDNTSPVIDHIEEFPIEEINRTNSSILLKATSDNSSSFTIVEMGLYANTENGEILFSVVSGLSISQSVSLGYELLFNISIITEIVNTVYFPKIVMNTGDTTFTQGDFMNMLYEVESNQVAPLSIEPIEVIGKSVHDSNFNSSVLIKQNTHKIQKYFNILCCLRDEKCSIKGAYNLTKEGFSRFKVNDLCNNLESLEIIEDSLKFDTDNESTYLIKPNSEGSIIARNAEGSLEVQKELERLLFSDDSLESVYINKSDKVIFIVSPTNVSISINGTISKEIPFSSTVDIEVTNGRYLLVMDNLDSNSLLKVNKVL